MFEGAWDFEVCCFSGHLLALPAAGTAAASAASAAAIVVTAAKAVVKTRVAAEAADAAAVPAAAGKASKCPAEQQTKGLNPPSNLALLCDSSDPG